MSLTIGNRFNCAILHILGRHYLSNNTRPQRDYAANESDQMTDLNDDQEIQSGWAFAFAYNKMMQVNIWEKSLSV